jgi:signal transduction histidine kinase
MTTPMAPGAAPPPTAPQPRHGSLAWRLALLLGSITLAVLLLTGIVVNRVVSSGYESALRTQQQDRLDTAADGLVTILADAQTRAGALARIRAQLERLAAGMGGQLTVRGPNGATLVTIGQDPAGSTVHLESAVVAGGTTVATLTMVVPATGADRGFLRLFNVTLVVAGLLSVAGIVLLALYGTNRLTRPLRTVVDAAHRLGGGDVSARAGGGPDQESAELADAFNLMADRLARSEMLRRRAASDMAHDLATPATVLESQLQAMVDGVVPADGEQLETARAAASALGSVIGQMGELASAESAPLQRRPGRIEVGAAVAEAARGVEALARDRGVSLAVDPATPLFSIVDPDQLGRAARNVVTNAIQHSPTGATVRIRLWASPAEVEVRITDQGPGIAAEDLPHVFERFYRADRARGTDQGIRRPGSGIGLTIARELLAANGGRIVVERTGPEGTTFLIGLPRVA